MTKWRCISQWHNSSSI